MGRQTSLTSSVYVTGNISIKDRERWVAAIPTIAIYEVTALKDQELGKLLRACTRIRANANKALNKVNQQGGRNTWTSHLSRMKNRIIEQLTRINPFFDVLTKEANTRERTVAACAEPTPKVHCPYPGCAVPNCKGEHEPPPADQLEVTECPDCKSHNFFHPEDNPDQLGCRDCGRWFGSDADFDCMMDTLGDKIPGSSGQQPLDVADPAHEFSSPEPSCRPALKAPGKDPVQTSDFGELETRAAASINPKVLGGLELYAMFKDVPMEEVLEFARQGIEGAVNKEIKDELAKATATIKVRDKTLDKQLGTIEHMRKKCDNKDTELRDLRTKLHKMEKAIKAAKKITATFDDL